jgi:Flp pilus assembly protein TadG
MDALRRPFHHRHEAARAGPRTKAARRGPRSLWSSLRREEGQVLVLACGMMVVLLAVAGLSIDLGTGWATKQSARMAASAAAAAGADDLPGSASQAQADALAMAATDGFQSGVGGVTVAVHVPPVSSQSHNGNPDSVEVDITRQWPTDFLQVLGIDRMTVTAQAVATAAPVVAPPCAICVLNPSGGTALEANGVVQVSVQGAGIAVDSTSSAAGVFNGSVAVSAPDIRMAGDYVATGDPSLTPTPQTGAQPVPDPLASVPAPAVTGPLQGSVALASGSETIQPGIYSGIAVSGGDLTLSPGTYVITGAFSVSGDAAVTGDGVTLYFTCSAYSASNPAPCDGSAGGGLTLSGGTNYSLQAPSSGTYQGLTVFYDRGNTAPLTVAGSVTSDGLKGTVYLADGQLVVDGSSEVTEMDSMLIANNVVLNGDGNIAIDYSSADNAPLPPEPGSSVLTE